MLSCRRSGLALAVGLLLGGAAFAYADSLPGELRNRIEQQTVSIRVADKATGQMLEYATGLIVAESEGQLFILTARHAVRVAGFALDEVRIEVRPRWHDRWVSAGGVRFESEPEDDVAVLTVGRQAMGAEQREFNDTLAQSPANVATPKSTAWLLGHDIDRDKLVWLEGAIRYIDAPVIGFDAVGLKPGYSGGVLVGSLGPVGLIQTAGSSGRSHRSWSLDAAAEMLAKAGVPMKLGQSPVLAALTNALERERLVALFLWDGRGNKTHATWSAIRLTARDGRVFSGDMLTTRGGGSCQIEWDTGGARLRAPRAAWRGGLFKELVNLRLFSSSSCLLDGFVTLEAESNGLLGYLAIPAGNNELLAARALANGATSDWTGVDIPDPLPRALEFYGPRRLVTVQGRLEPFVMNSLPVGQRGGFAAGATTVIWIPRAHDLDAVDVTGAVLLPDGHRQLGEKARQGYANMVIEVDAAPNGGSPTRLGNLIDPTSPVPFRARVCHAPKGIQFLFNGRGHGSAPPLLHGLTLTYRTKE